MHRRFGSLGLVAIILMILAAAVLLGAGATGCVRDRVNKSIGKENLQLAREAYDCGDIEKALEYALGADYDYENTDISKDKADTHAMLFLLYYMAGLEEESLAKIERMPQQEVELLNNGSRANYYLLSAYLHAVVDRDTLKALAYTDSLKRHHAVTNPGDTAMNYLDINNIVEIYAAIGDTADSWQLIRRMELNPVEPISKYSHQLNINKARLFAMAGQIDSASVYARKILRPNYNENVDAYNRTLAYEILMREDSIRGDLKAYAAHRDSLDHLRYEIQGNRKKYLIAAFEGRNQAESLLKDMKIQKSENIIWILTICFISLFILAVTLWKYSERKARHRIAVLECTRLSAEVKNRQLQCERLAGEVRTRTDELSHHIVEKEELTRQLRKAMQDVAAISPIDHLRLRLNQEHPEFMAMLNQRFPEISANDRLILGAIKAGFTPKEIAAALSISHSSLLTARYRLRKKLVLDPNQDLDEFVASLLLA